MSDGQFNVMLDKKWHWPCEDSPLNDMSDKTFSNFLRLTKIVHIMV